MSARRRVQFVINKLMILTCTYKRCNNWRLCIHLKQNRESFEDVQGKKSEKLRRVGENGFNILGIRKSKKVAESDSRKGSRHLNHSL